MTEIGLEPDKFMIVCCSVWMCVCVCVCACVCVCVLFMCLCKDWDQWRKWGIGSIPPGGDSPQEDHSSQQIPEAQRSSQ